MSTLPWPHPQDDRGLNHVIQGVLMAIPNAAQQQVVEELGENDAGAIKVTKVVTAVDDLIHKFHVLTHARTYLSTWIASSYLASSLVQVVSGLGLAKEAVAGLAKGLPAVDPHPDTEFDQDELPNDLVEHLHALDLAMPPAVAPAPQPAPLERPNRVMLIVGVAAKVLHVGHLALKFRSDRQHRARNNGHNSPRSAQDVQPRSPSTFKLGFANVVGALNLVGTVQVLIREARFVYRVITKHRIDPQGPYTTEMDLHRAYTKELVQMQIANARGPLAFFRHDSLPSALARNAEIAEIANYGHGLGLNDTQLALAYLGSLAGQWGLLRLVETGSRRLSGRDRRIAGKGASGGVAGLRAFVATRPHANLRPRDLLQQEEGNCSFSQKSEQGLRSALLQYAMQHVVPLLPGDGSEAGPETRIAGGLAGLVMGALPMI